MSTAKEKSRIRTLIGCLVVIVIIGLWVAFVMHCIATSKQQPFNDPSITRELAKLLIRESDKLSEWSAKRTYGGCEFTHTRLNVTIGREIRDFYRMNGDKREDYSDFTLYSTWDVDHKSVETAYRNLWKAYFQRLIETNTDGK